MNPARLLGAAPQHDPRVEADGVPYHPAEPDLGAVLVYAQAREVDEQLIPYKRDPLRTFGRVTHAELVSVPVARARVAEAGLEPVPIVEREIAYAPEEVRLELEPRLLGKGAGGEPVLPPRLEREPVRHHPGLRCDCSGLLCRRDCAFPDGAPFLSRTVSIL